MDRVDQPTPALHAMVFRFLRTADTHVTPVITVISNMTKTLTDVEASALPIAIRNVLPLLRGHTDKLRIAMDIASQLDLFELASAGVKLAVETRDSRLTMLAAALCGNPAADSDARRYLRGEHPDDPLVQIRMNPDHITSSAREERLHLQRWPGKRTRENTYRLTPTVVIDCGLPPAFVLRLASSMASHGLMVRRLPHDVSIPDWFGPETVFVASSTPPRGISQRLRTSGTRRVVVREEAPELDRVTEQITGALPESLVQRTRLRQETPYALWKPSIYELGRYRTREAAWHTGTNIRQWHRFNRKGWIKPQVSSSGRELWWTFRDIVAVRTWSYLQTAALKDRDMELGPRVSQKVICRLAEFGGSDNISMLGVASNGDVIAQTDDDWFNLDTGNYVIEPAVTSDEVFKPFNHGDVRVLDLLAPNRDTRVHPTITDGKPHVYGCRIPAVGIARIHARSGLAGVLEFYPSLADRSFSGAIEVGKELLA